MNYWKYKVEHNVSTDNFNEVCMYLSSICVAIEPDVQRTDDQASSRQVKTSSFTWKNRIIRIRLICCTEMQFTITFGISVLNFAKFLSLFAI